MRSGTHIAAAIALGALAAPAALWAQAAPADPQPQSVIPVEDGEAEQTPILPDDSAFTAGGGVVQFTKNGMNNVSDLGGMLELRGIMGTRSLLGAEAAYVGSLHPMDALGLDDDALLLGNSFEGAVRFSPPMNVRLQPYAIGGVGVSRYQLIRAETNTSNVADGQNMIHYPLGVGMLYRHRPIIIDARIMYRATNEENLIPQERLDRWSASASAGYLF